MRSRPDGSGPVPGLGLLVTLVFRLWSIVQGPVTAALIVAILTPAGQGLWYAFVALSRWQTLGDLGFGSLIQQFASHEAALPETPQSRRRLGSLLRIAVGYAGLVGAAMLALLLASGSAVLDAAGEPTLHAAWTALAVLTVVGWGGTLALLPIVEGSGAVATAAGVRLAQSALGRFAAWAVLVLGGGCWGLVVERIVAVAVLAFAAFTRRAGLAASWREGRRGGISLPKELLPIAWRTALGTLGGFAPWALAVPGALVWLGAAEAGRLGLGLAVLGGFAGVWDGVVQARVPALAMRAARAEHTLADAEWRRLIATSCGGFVGCGLGFVVLVGVWHAAALPRADRLPETGAACLMGLGGAVRFVRGQLLVWARTHKREPFWPIDAVGGLVAILVFPPAARSGLMGLLGAWLTVDVCVLLTTTFGAISFLRARGSAVIER